MSFKDNLVYLRTSNSLTQERLAVLLGVSRQAISKWESDHAYPEMDKLLTICQVFDCGLDDLVQGDLTHPSPRDSGENSTHPTSTPVKTLGVAAQPKTEDFTGYDQHWRSFAWRLGVGIGLIVAGLAAAAATSDLLPQALADFGAFTSLALGTVSGLAFVIPAGLSHGQFRRLHPFVEDFYSEADRARRAGLSDVHCRWGGADFVGHRDAHPGRGCAVAACELDRGLRAGLFRSGNVPAGLGRCESRALRRRWLEPPG